MSVKIGIIGDIHATVGPLREALTIFAREGVALVLCLGDIAGYGTELGQCIELLADRDCVTILGNHDVWSRKKNSNNLTAQAAAFIDELPATWEAVIEGKKIFAVHASPPHSMEKGITLLDQYGHIMADKKKQWGSELAEYELDVLAVGHTHQVYSEVLGRLLVINPGSTKFNNSCATLRFPDLDFTVFPLPGKKIRKVWHWGMMR